MKERKKVMMTQKISVSCDYGGGLVFHYYVGKSSPRIDALH